MHIVVTLKQVFDPNTPPALLQVGADGLSLDLRSGMSPVLNGYDANAIEGAIQLKEKLGGRITVVSVGDDQSIGAIRRAVAMGADAGIHIEGGTGLACDSEVTASLIAAAIRKLGPVDLVLSGKASSDTDGGQVMLCVAEKLGFCAVTPVKAINAVDAHSITVDRICEDVTQRINCILPAVLGVSNEINKPRAPGLKGVMMAKKLAIPTWGATELGIDAPTPFVTLQKIYIKPASVVQTQMISSGSAESDGRALAECLAAEGLI